MMDRLADFRAVFAEVVTARAGCSANTAVLGAFRTVPRHEFLGAGPWIVREDGAKTASCDPAVVYQDIGLGLTESIPTGLPSLHAALLDAVAVQPGDRVLQIGAGTGYFTAILAELVGPSGRVYAFEIDPTLAARAQRNLAGWPWVSVEARSGAQGNVPSADVTYVNAGIQQLPRQWIDALPVGGRMVFPLVAADGGAVFLVRRTAETAFPARFVCRARFVPCIGTQEEGAKSRLAQLLRDDGCLAVRSLRLDELDETVWFSGEGWWLSIQEPSLSRT
jgi:protein-L-isoaspartate(D-aspartate) O-methyltransferase